VVRAFVRHLRQEPNGDGSEGALAEHRHGVVTPGQPRPVPDAEPMRTVTYDCRDQPGRHYLAG